MKAIARLKGWLTHMRHQLSRVDWRIRTILAATAVAVVLTFAVILLGYGKNPSTFFGAVFAGWVSGLALFAFIGGIVAVVSLARPEEESFDARARILFRRQTGKHIDYIVTQIRRILEHYSEYVENRIIIREYDANEQKYWLTWEGKTVIRSYIDDIATSYRSDIAMDDVARPPQGAQPNRLKYFRIGGAPHGGEDFDGERIRRPFETTIERAESCCIEHCIDYWSRAKIGSGAKEEENKWSPRRYTQAVKLIVENHLPGNRTVNVFMSYDGGASFQSFELLPGESKTLCEVKDVLPSVEVYDLRIAPLT